MSDLIAFPETTDQMAFRINREESLLVNAELQRRIQWYQRRHWEFWGHFDVITPDKLLENRGENALRWLLAVRAERTYLQALAELRGQTLAQLIGEQFANPPREFIPGVNAQGQFTGYVTLGPPAQGHDAWGRPLNPPPQEGEPGP